MTKTQLTFTEQEALELHASGRPGKIEVVVSKPLTTQRDLALAYSPGVAIPCQKIADHPDDVYLYTNKGNMVAVITNGTAVLGLGDLGAEAAKPVMEGKAGLFKRFADVDAIDIGISTKDVDAFINSVRYLAPSFGGINLEDIKAPDCFIIEQKLRELMNIPVFHDDQHGTAIIAAAALLNALTLTKRTTTAIKVVFNGAGAAAISCIEMLKLLGVPAGNIILCDSKGVVYAGRNDGMNAWKSKHATNTKLRTLADALKGADVFIGLSVKDAVTADMIATMADQPIVFAMANPDPEITPDAVRRVKPDAIIATGRSDYPNQVNNVLGFPYIFRGALDVHATTINDDMKLAAARALAELAKQDVPDEVAMAYGHRLRFGADYIIPTPLDPRLISEIPPAVAKAAMESGVVRKRIDNMRAYKQQLSARLNRTYGTLQRIYEHVLNSPSQRVVFAEGEEEKAIRAALSFQAAGYGKAILVAREERVKETMFNMGLEGIEHLEIHNAKLSHRNEAYTEFLYKKLQRKGFLVRDCQRLVNQDRNVFAACMLALGDADAMVTGLTRTYPVALREVFQVISPKAGERAFGFTLVASKANTILMADTSVKETPSSEELVELTLQAVKQARRFGLEPRVALLSFSNFGNPTRPEGDRIRQAVRLLEQRQVDFEFDGEMSADVALDESLLKLYPFCRLTKPANVLIMPGLHSAHISSKLLQKLGHGTTVIGPLIAGLNYPAQIVPMSATVSDIVNYAVLAAHSALEG